MASAGSVGNEQRTAREDLRAPWRSSACRCGPEIPRADTLGDRKVPHSGQDSRRAASATDGPAERAAHDIDDLVDVLVGLAVLRRRAYAALDVVLEDEDREGV